MPEHTYITCMISTCCKNANRMHDFTDLEMECYDNIRKLVDDGKELDAKLVNNRIFSNPDLCYYNFCFFQCTAECFAKTSDIFDTDGNIIQAKFERAWFKFYEKDDWLDEIMVANYPQCLASAQGAAKELTADKTTCNGGAVLYFLAECLYYKIEMDCPDKKTPCNI